MAINQQRRRFCQFIVSGKNQTRSALEAGYKESSAKAIGSQLMALDEIKDYIEALKQLDNKYDGQPPIIEDVETATLCRDPIEKLITLMNCNDEAIELQAATKLLPYFYLKKSELEAPKKLGIREMKEASAIEATTESKFSTLDNQLNIYEHEKE